MEEKKSSVRKKQSPVTPEVKKPENLVQAVIQVMSEIKGIEKNLEVGSGKLSYKGVSDKDVKKIVGEAMERAGLIILPIEIDPTIQVDRWEETNQYGTKQKQSVFVEVKTKYILIHESGEQREIVGYGHGVDSMDKAAGKATTYALKYALLYAFMIPTGAIDDSDTSHSEEQKIVPKKKALTDAQYLKALEAIEKGEYEPKALINDYQLKPEWIEELKKNYNV